MKNYKMKIAIVTDAIYPFTLGGSEIRNHEIAKRLVKKGHEVHIYGAKLWKGKDIIEIDNVIIHGIHEYERLYDKNGKRKILDPVLLSIKLFFKLLKADYDLIDNASFAYFNCFSTKLVSAIKRKPLIFTWHQYFGDYLLGYFGKFKGAIAMSLERLSTKLTKNNLAVSNNVKSELIKRNIKENQIKVIYNGADTNLIKSIKAKNKKYDLIYVGRLNYQKNLTLLINAVNLLKKDFPKIKVCIIGGGNEDDNLKKLTENYKLKNNLDFLGEIKEKNKIFKLLKSSKIFVLPSLLEGFPLTIIEANASGIPVITTKTKYNNTSEYIKNNENGLIANPNPEDFSNAIKTLLNNKAKLKAMSKTSIKKAKPFDWDKIAQEQEEYYTDVIKYYHKLKLIT